MPSQLTGLEKLRSRRKSYAEKWSETASWHAQAGHYKWMSDQLDLLSGSRILEIGTGTGAGTEELLSRGYVVVGLDENIECLQRTQARLQTAGYEIALENREVAFNHGAGHRLSYRVPNSKMPASGALLMSSDVLKDPSLEEWIARFGKFDAVICWLIGTHDARLGANEEVVRRRVQSPGDYRIVVQNTVYELADRILRPGGVLSVVDRAETPDDETKIQDFRNSHSEQAEPTDLEIVSVSYLPTESPSVEGGKAMQMTPGISGRLPEVMTYSLVSVTSRKPESPPAHVESE